MEWKLKTHDEEQYNSLRAAGLVPLFCSLLSNRGFPNVRNKNQVNDLIKSPLTLIEDSTSIPNMDLASDIILQVKGEHAVIFGDYDVDGIVSSYLCEKLLVELGAESVDVYLPSRVDDGYGLNEKSVKHFLSICKKDYAIVMVLDCGSSSHNQIEDIRKQLPNAKIVIVDHHIINDEEFSSNADTVVNYRLGNVTPYCTGGLIYQLARMCAQKAKVFDLAYLPYAAIATISDVCDMIGSNRIIVRNGLECLAGVTDPGIVALFKIAEVDQKFCNTEDISFKIGPLINASGRMRLASTAYKLLRCSDPEKAAKISRVLKDMNEERKKIQNSTAEEAFEMFENHGKNRKSALLFQRHWNPGIVGIVASKVAERYQVPTICFGMSKGQIKGSARSVQGINIKKVMDICSGIFLKYGGHEMAAGAVLDPICVETAWDSFNEAVMMYMGRNNISDPSLLYDFEVDMDLMQKMDEVFCQRLVKLEPYGPGNETPIFRANRMFCSKVKEWGSGKGGFIMLDNTCLGAFSFGPDLAQKIEGKTIDILFSISRSFIRGESWQIKIVDFKETK